MVLFIFPCALPFRRALKIKRVQIPKDRKPNVNKLTEWMQLWMLRGIRREYGCGCYWVREGGRRRGVAGNRNHKNNNHIIVFNNEKYHFRHNFWLLFVQAKNFLFLFPLPPFVSTG